MKDSIRKISSIGGDPLGRERGLVRADAACLDVLERSQLLRLLDLKNGFYAFENALHVFPSVSTDRECGLADWNSTAGWRASYQGLADGCFFFAEDVFGGQFCLFDGTVMSFDPETGEKRHLAANVEEWASRVLDEYDVLTGHSLAHEWQLKNGPIPSGKRLIPKVPFVLGGDFVVDNLFLLDSARAMRSRANLAVQIRDLPDGSQVTFRVVD